MKRPILLAILAIAVIFGYWFWGNSPKTAAVVQKPADKTVKSEEFHAVPSVLPPTTLSVAAAQPAVSHSATDARAAVFDSPDVLRKVIDIRSHGTPDEKYWATYLLRDCTILFVKQPSNSSYPNGSSSAEANASSEDGELAAERKSALDSLKERCKGFQDLSVQDRNSLRRDLIERNAGNPSELGRLYALIRSRDNRWTDDQSTLITKSLYSGDPIIEQYAFTVLRGAIDTLAPGGKDRYDALNFALDPHYGYVPLSEFERLNDCQSMGQCASNAQASTKVPVLSSEARRLTEIYKSAVQSGSDVRSILAIH